MHDTATSFLSFLILLMVGNVLDDADWRDLYNGRVIPSNNYAEQPYIVEMKNGNWLCTVTTGPGGENAGRQHVGFSISSDKGKTWSPLVYLEPAVVDPKTSWAIPFTTPSGRVYVFYNVSGVKNEDAASIGLSKDQNEYAKSTACTYCFRYSDDYGKTWSKKRYRVPIRRGRIDHENDNPLPEPMHWGWCIDPPSVDGEENVFFLYTKFRGFNMFRYIDSEGWLVKSDNLLTEADPEKVRWTTYPEGGEGIYSPKYRGDGTEIQTEWNSEPLSKNGGIYAICRTKLGFALDTYSSDGGRTWSEPTPATYTPGGDRIMKTPRACPRVWRDSKGRYLFWFHNNNGATDSYGARNPDHPLRNPVWVAGGIEKTGKIYWSQPELLLYESYRSLASGGQRLGSSYPDFLEINGRYWVTETNKHDPRIHEIPAEFLEGIWSQATNNSVVKKGLVLDRKMPTAGAELPMPHLPSLKQGGLSINLSVRFDNLDSGQLLLDSRDADGKGIALTTTDKKTVQIEISDGKNRSRWDCDPGLLTAGKEHSLTFIVDGLAKIISVAVDDQLCDGGRYRPFGWSRLTKGITPKKQGSRDTIRGFAKWWGANDREITDVTGGNSLKIAPKLNGQLKSLRIYDRYLRTYEALANHKADAK